jgi:hypothetical protein
MICRAIGAESTPALDMRGFGERSPYTADERGEGTSCNMWPGDVDTAWQYLVSQPGVKRDVIGVAGAGSRRTHSVGVNVTLLR